MKIKITETALKILVIAVTFILLATCLISCTQTDERSTLNEEREVLRQLVDLKEEGE